MCTDLHALTPLFPGTYAKTVQRGSHCPLVGPCPQPSPPGPQHQGQPSPCPPDWSGMGAMDRAQRMAWGMLVKHGRKQQTCQVAGPGSVARSGPWCLWGLRGPCAGPVPSMRKQRKAYGPTWGPTRAQPCACPGGTWARTRGAPVVGPTTTGSGLGTWGPLRLAVGHSPRLPPRAGGARSWRGAHCCKFPFHPYFSIICHNVTEARAGAMARGEMPLDRRTHMWVHVPT